MIVCVWIIIYKIDFGKIKFVKLILFNSEFVLMWFIFYKIYLKIYFDGKIIVWIVLVNINFRARISFYIFIFDVIVVKI